MTTAKKPSKSPKNWKPLVLSIEQFTPDFMTEHDYGVIKRTDGKKVRTRRGSRVSNGRCAT
jgi:hypothetical protein